MAALLDPTPTCLARTAARRPGHPASFVRHAQAWQPTSWAALWAQVQRAARALVALGVQRGQAVCILGFNRPEWLVMAHATAVAGARVAGIYWTSSASEVQYIVAHSQCALLLVEDAAQAAKLEGARDSLPVLRHVVALLGAAIEGAVAWHDFMAGGEPPALQDEVDARLAALDPQAGCRRGARGGP